MKSSVPVKFAYILFVVASLVLFSCRNQFTGPLFKSQSPHQRYEQQLRKAGLDKSLLFRQWNMAAEASVIQPQRIEIPYQEMTYLPPDRAVAVGYLFEVRNGHRLKISLDLQSADSIGVFLDLFEWSADSSEQPKHLHSADTGVTALEYTVTGDTHYILRVQPELLADVSYRLNILAEASLSNPVASAMSIGSFFGDGRDAGARKHEGVDIFGKRLTPVLAAAAGRVSRVGDNRLGGKVVWLRPDDRNLSLYYAHLDSQLVDGGEAVKIGDTLGLMGNTGNAISTPPHLHFGIYTSGGAVDPLPFLRPGKSDPPNITSNIALIGDSLKVSIKNDGAPLHSPAFVEAAALNGYRIVLPDGRRTYLPKSHLSPLGTAIRTFSAEEEKPLYARPDIASAQVGQLLSGERTKVIALFGEFYLVEGVKKGWLKLE